MLGKLTLASAALALVVVTTAGAQPSTLAQDQSGRVARVDAGQHVVVLQDGRMYRLTPGTQVFVDNRPVALQTVAPGSTIVIRSGEPVVYENGQYVVMDRPAFSVPAPVAVAPSPVLVNPPAASIVTAPPAVTTAPGTTTIVTPGSSVTTITTTTPSVVTDATGMVSTYDAAHGVIVLSDGRMVQLTPSSVVTVNGQPVAVSTIYPGEYVAVSGVNPVVYRDGRYVVLNTGFRDAGNGGVMTWDSKYAGYEAETNNAAMQVQGGGG